MGQTGEDMQRLLEVSVALEIVKTERTHLQAKVRGLQDQLQQAQERARCAEARLHEVTLALADLSRQALAAQARSLATEVLSDGKIILRLSNPVQPANAPRRA